MGWKVLLPARSSGGQHSPTRLPKLLGASPPTQASLPPNILPPRRTPWSSQRRGPANAEHETKSLQSQPRSQEPKLLTGPSCWSHFLLSPWEADICFTAFPYVD